MHYLMLGGTAWLGGYLATTALAQGHDVTCLARGLSGSAPEGVALVQADRDRPDAYDAVAGQDWDVAIDVSRQPGHVRRATAALAERCAMFVFVSSGNVYADDATIGQDEEAPLWPALEGDVMETMATYGPAKVACEQHVLTAFGPDRSLIARAGLIGGPGDPSDRSGYWPWRFARPSSADGRVLVPDAPSQPAQLIDVRDVASWLVTRAASGLLSCDAGGIFNVMGSTGSLHEFLDSARSVAGHNGPVVPAGEEWLLAQGVEPWMGDRSLPLWLTPPDYGFASRSNARARSAGLVTRPLSETLADTLAWELVRDPDPRTQPRRRRAGLSDEDERTLLAALAAL